MFCMYILYHCICQVFCTVLLCDIHIYIYCKQGVIYNTKKNIYKVFTKLLVINIHVCIMYCVMYNISIAYIVYFY